MGDGEAAVTAPGGLGGDEGEDRLLGQRERAASPGGRRPEAAQRRRRSIEASVRGREPTALLVDPTMAGMTSALPT